MVIPLNLCDFFAILKPVGEKFSPVIGEKFLFFEKIFTPAFSCKIWLRFSKMFQGLDYSTFHDSEIHVPKAF